MSECRLAREVGDRISRDRVMTLTNVKIESIRSQIRSLIGVKKANVFLPTKIQYNERVIMKAIEQQIKKIKRN